ncbi:MAG: hypothetical protein SOZ09_04235 [Eubacteriales bacterium]|nr:hypothetical protein [Clostridiales bacterium]MDD7773078.1 hypothetical protein [Eubacteriales bacterium]MDY3941178.1 hypothetical protein [Eubacteriales bacterium]
MHKCRNAVLSGILPVQHSPIHQKTTDGSGQFSPAPIGHFCCDLVCLLYAAGYDFQKLRCFAFTVYIRKRRFPLLLEPDPGIVYDAEKRKQQKDSKKKSENAPHKNLPINRRKQ